MNPLVLIWTASLLGAVLFFTSGYLLQRSKQARRHPELETLRATVQSLQDTDSRHVQHIAELERLRDSELAQHAQELARIRGELEARQVREHEYAQRLAQAEHSARQLMAQKEHLERELHQRQAASPELSRARERVQELESALRAEAQNSQRSQRELTQARTEHKQLSVQITTLRTALAAAQAETKALEQRAASLASEKTADESQALSTARAECIRLRQRLESAEKARGQLAELKQETLRLQHQLGQAEQARRASQQQFEQRSLEAERLQREVGTAIERIQRLEAELKTAQGTAERLSGQLPAVRNEAAIEYRDQLEGLQKEIREQQLRNRMLTDRVAELQSYAEQNAALKNERDYFNQELSRLKQVQGSQSNATTATASLDTVREARRPIPITQSGTTRRVDSEETVESSLERHLLRLVNREPGITAVLSDDNGFPVAGVGPEPTQEGVSVLTSLAQELATRAVEFVDLDPIKQMELVDEAGRALRVRFFTWQDQGQDHNLALGCLGASHIQPNMDEEQIVTGFPSILLASSA